MLWHRSQQSPCRTCQTYLSVAAQDLIRRGRGSGDGARYSLGDVALRMRLIECCDGQSSWDFIIHITFNYITDTLCCSGRNSARSRFHPQIIRVRSLLVLVFTQISISTDKYSKWQNQKREYISICANLPRITYIYTTIL